MTRPEAVYKEFSARRHLVLRVMRASRQTYFHSRQHRSIGG
ncbi:MAG: hypothetical protein P8Y69_07905 [Gammaproteobacteria bacterium]